VRYRKQGKTLVVNTYGVPNDGYFCKLVTSANTCPIIEEIDSGVEPSTDPEIVCTFDESQNSVFKNDTEAEFMPRTVRQNCRSYKIGIICIAHNLRSFDTDSLNLAHTIVVMASGPQDLQMVREPLGDAYKRAKMLRHRQGIVLLKDRIRQPLHIMTFNSPKSFFEIPDSQSLDEQSRKFRDSVPLTKEKAPLPVQRKTKTKPAPKHHHPEPAPEPDEADTLTQLKPGHNVIAGVHRRFPHFNQGKLIEELDKLAENDSMSRQTSRKYLSEMVQKGFLSEVRISLGRGRPKVYYVPGKLGEAFYKQKYGTILSTKKPRGGGLHLIVLLNAAEKLRRLFPNAKITTGDTKICRNTGIGELDIVVIIGDKIYIYEVDISAHNLDEERVQKILSIGATRLTIICEKVNLEKNQRLVEIDERVVVGPLNNWMID